MDRKRRMKGNSVASSKLRVPSRHLQHFVFTMLHFVFIMFRTWRHAGRGIFSIVSSATNSRQHGWGFLHGQALLKTLAGDSWLRFHMAENSWLRIPGSGNLWALNAWGRVFFHGWGILAACMGVLGLLDSCRLVILACCTCAWYRKF